MIVCDWHTPGADRYTGTVAAAIESYADIPAPTRAVLRDKAARHAFDDQAVITRDTVRGAHEYGDLRDMHFGSSGRVCSAVDRSKWTPDATERGLVYCADSHCIIVPSVCGNVARITRRTAPLQEKSFEQLAVPTEESLVALAPGESASFAEAAGVPYITAVPPAPSGGAQGGAQGGAVVFASGAVARGPDVVAAIPEPSTYALLFLGLCALLGYRRARK